MKREWICPGSLACWGVLLGRVFRDCSLNLVSFGTRLAKITGLSFHLIDPNVSSKVRSD